MKPLVPLFGLFALSLLPLLLAPQRSMPLTPEELAADIALCDEIGGVYDQGCQPY